MASCLHSVSRMVCQLRPGHALLCVLIGFNTGLASAEDHFVAASIGSFDCSDVRPGDTVTLSGGVRGEIKITGCSGTSAAPITIRNDPASKGPTIIQRSSGGDGGFLLSCANCTETVIDGSKKWVGAPTTKTYGIKITMTGGGSPGAFLSISGRSRFLTVRNVEIDGQWPRLSSDGIGIYVNDHSVKAVDNPGVWREGIVLENNYVHDVQGEGMYVGPNWHQGDLPLRNIVISGNIVENTGWEGINLKSSISGDNRIHHNVLKRVGKNIDKSDGQHTGIEVFEGGARIYNNWIEGSGEAGIAHYISNLPASYGAQIVEIFNNVIVNPGQTGPQVGHGISSSNQDGSAPISPRIYNNTIVGAEGGGIRVGARAQGGFVRANLVAGAGDTAIGAPSAIAVTNNLTGSIADMNFVDPSALDFQLKTSSPARNTGSGSSPPTDYLDRARPQEGAADRGAFEFNVDDVKPTPPTSLVVE